MSFALYASKLAAALFGAPSPTAARGRRFRPGRAGGEESVATASMLSWGGFPPAHRTVAQVWRMS